MRWRSVLFVSLFMALCVPVVFGQTRTQVQSGSGVGGAAAGYGTTAPGTIGVGHPNAPSSSRINPGSMRRGTDDPRPGLDYRPITPPEDENNEQDQDGLDQEQVLPGTIDRSGATSPRPESRF